MTEAVLLFLRAVAADDEAEAKRVYEEMMTVEERGQVDVVENMWWGEPGSMKTWLRRKSLPPPFADHVSTDADPADARAASTYTWWKAEAARSPTFSAFENLGIACEARGRKEDAIVAYTKAIELLGHSADSLLLRGGLEERLERLRTR